MTAPIGGFDSGVGGLSVMREIARRLPQEALLYVADSGHAPYGDKPAAFVRERSLLISRFLVDQGAKAIVVACNTATGIAVEALRATFTVPIIAIEPAVKPAATRTQSGRVAVLATTRTLETERYMALVRRHAQGVDVRPQPCPGLVEQVEAGDLDGAATRALVERYVRPLLDDGVDTLVLGCTHYSFLRAVITQVAGPDVAVIDPSPAVAAEVERRLGAVDLLRRAGVPGDGDRTSGEMRICSTGDAGHAAAMVSRLWTGRASVEPAADAGLA